MHILGISAFYHDSAAALLRDGELVAAVQEERYSRVKFDARYPAAAIDYCLRSAGITAQDLDYVVFYEKPLPKFERILSSHLASFPRSWQVFREAAIAWLGDKLWVKTTLARNLGVPLEKILFVEHHLSHAASAVFCAPFQETAVLTIDGVGEWTTTALGKATTDWQGGTANRIELTRELRFPHSLGLLYSAFTAWLGFKVNSGEYKLMGMAPYGEPRYLDKLEKLVQVFPDGSFRLNMDYFSFHRSLTQSFSPRFCQLLGPPREPESPFFTATTGDDLTGREEAARQNQYYADVAASLQRLTEEILLKMAAHLHRETGLKNLSIAGGVALNSVANGRIMRESPFEQVYIQPNAGDAGGALGAALYAYHVLLGRPRKFAMEHAYYGEESEPGAIQSAIQAQGLPSEHLEDPGAQAERLVDTMLKGGVVAVHQGRAEWGPRALGNRSILADPRRDEMKEIVNSKVKFRESFRPFAPVVLEERAEEFFAMGRSAGQYPQRFMLMVSPLVEGRETDIPAVSHMGTGRLQVVRPEWNALYAECIARFGQETGVPVLLNTSFNLRGEPLVNTPTEALTTFGASDIDLLSIGPYLVRKSG